MEPEVQELMNTHGIDEDHAEEADKLISDYGLGEEEAVEIAEEL